MDEHDILVTLRAMAWQRAKGELLAYLGTYWPKYKSNGETIDDGFDDAQKRITDFIKDFEDRHVS